jgi:tetratricopeptide (TPR) repeat protein
MPTIKIQVGKSFILFLAAVTFFAGCSPPGPRALLQGRKLLEEGHYAEAVEKLRLATQLLGTTNAQAYNYLGVACHQAGNAAEAEKAYQRALTLNPDLAEARFNLGCLWLDENKLEQAKLELTGYTLRRANSYEGWLKLGSAQLRASESGPSFARAADLAAAERSLNTALGLSPRSAEAMTYCGLVKVRRGRATEGAQLFRSALVQQPDYRPALLNLAIVEHQFLNDHTQALKNYREYLALKPTPDNAESVRMVVSQLEQELAPAGHSVAGGSGAMATNPLPASPMGLEAVHNPVTNKPPFTNAVRAAVASRPDLVNTSRPATVAAAPKPVPLPAAVPASNFTVETLPAEPALKAAQDSPSAMAAASNTGGRQPELAANPNTSNQPADKRTLLQRLNPVSLFSDSKPAPTLPLTNTAAASDGSPPQALPSDFPRYSYHSAAKPSRGNRVEAERSFAQGIQAQQAQHPNEAIPAYRRATQIDPSYFDAYYNLGLAASEAGNLTMALSAYESALTIKPDSVNARYNFALTLKQGNYCNDAAHELEQLLRREPNDSRAHLALGNLYAQQFQQPTLARPHYLKVLENDPRNPQAGAIRYWLTDNPP